MIAMAVCDQDMGDALAARGVGDCRKMHLIGGTRVDDRHAAAANEIGVGAEKGVGRRVVRNDAANLRRNLLGYAVVDLNASIEGKLCRHGLDYRLPNNARPILAKRDSDGSAARNSTLICKGIWRKMWPLRTKTYSPKRLEFVA